MAKRASSCACGIARKRTYRERESLANAPISPYHHKTESPGAAGRHRLSDMGAVRACQTWITKAGTLMKGCYNSKGQFRIKGRA